MWFKQQYDHGQFRLLKAGATEQVGDVFTQPFTEKNKWVHAQTGHASSMHAGCRPESYIRVDDASARMDDEKVFGVSDVGWRKGILKTSRTSLQGPLIQSSPISTLSRTLLRLRLRSLA